MKTIMTKGSDWMVMLTDLFFMIDLTASTLMFFNIQHTICNRRGYFVNQTVLNGQ